MDKSKLKEQSEIIRQAFGYIDRFKNELFVIKIDDILISNPLFPILIKDLVLLHRMGIVLFWFQVPEPESMRCLKPIMSVARP
jgi:hypothetical protein